MLVKIAAGPELFHTAIGTAFVDLLIDGHRETWPIRNALVHRARDDRTLGVHKSPPRARGGRLGTATRGAARDPGHRSSAAGHRPCNPKEEHLA